MGGGRLEMELRASDMLGKCSKLHPQFHERISCKMTDAHFYKTAIDELQESRNIGGKTSYEATARVKVRSQWLSHFSNFLFSPNEMPYILRFFPLESLPK